MDTFVQSSAFCALLVFFFLSLQTWQLLGASTFSCREDERDALLQFRSGLKEALGSTPWVGDDCCSWYGIECSNSTGHVIGLKMMSMEGDEISPSLLSLPELSYLDLSDNIFRGASIPKFFGSFKRLRHLDLSFSYFIGKIPQELGNLSSLRYLDLSMNHLDDIRLDIEDGSWLSGLSSLRYLNLDSVDIKNADVVIESLGMLPFLSNLQLTTSLTSFPATLPHVNFTSLRRLDLSSNHLNTTLPSWLFEIGSLRHLDLSSNNFVGHVPSTMSNLTSLEFLDLSYNELPGRVLAASTGIGELSNLRTLNWRTSDLSGQLPLWLSNLKNLQTLDLSYNQLNGTLSVLGQLNGLVFLDLASNSFDDVLTSAHLQNLTKLEYLFLKDNSLTIKFGPERICPQLKQIDFGNCNVGPPFPSWLQKMDNISSISLSNAGISDTVPDWFWKFSSNLSEIDLSNNMIRGKLPSSFTNFTSLTYLNMMNNQLEGPFPQFSRNLQILILNNNSISGAIPSNIGNVHYLQFLYVSGNKLNGSIPTSACSLVLLQFLDLSNNQLAGGIPDCFGNMTSLMAINLGNNNLSGGIPASVGTLTYLESLHLERNNLSGGLPLGLKNCTALRTLNLGNNKFTGRIPTWLAGNFEFEKGKIMPTCNVNKSLYTLSLRSNMFVGEIPRGLGNLPCLKVIDLSQNMLSGSIPQSFENLSAMKSSYPNENGYNDENDYINFAVGKSVFEEYRSIDVVTKGRHEEFGKLLQWWISIDLSSNNLSGEIPKGLATLSRLQNLNLSRNHLTGPIPQNVTGLQHMESLDLSYNNLTGEIPMSMTVLNSLGVMNFSFNNLSGRIPTGGPFQSHPDTSIYLGNSDLCGFPLTSCVGSVSSQTPQVINGSQDEDENIWFYLSMAPGFVTGFWAVIGALLLKDKWRTAYYQYIDSMYDKLYVSVAIKLANMRRS